MTTIIATPPKNGNPGIVPPWLRPPIPVPLPGPGDDPHTWEDVERFLKRHGFVEFRCDEFPIPTEYQKETL